MDSQQEEQAQITMTATTLYPTGSSGIRHSLKQYGEKTFCIKPTDSKEFCQKRHFEVIRPLLCSLSGYRELKLTTKLFAGCIPCSLLMQMLNISL